MVEKYLNAFSICSYVLFFLAILIEYLISYKNNLNNYEKNDSFFNIGTGLFYLIFPVILGTSLTIFLYEIFSKFAFFEMPGVWSALIRGEKLYWWAFLILIFTDDFCYYWFHRISHVSRFLWCIHEVHHSSKKYNFTVFLN